MGDWGGVGTIGNRVHSAECRMQSAEPLTCTFNERLNYLYR